MNKNFPEQLTFQLIKTIEGYSIYYGDINSQRSIGLHVGRSQQTFFVLAGNEIVFSPTSYRSQWQAITQCEQFIQQQLNQNA